MTIFTRQLSNPGNLGMKSFKPISTGAVVPWWNPLSSAAITARAAAGGLWAWRAQANDNVTWGAGPANYAASLVSVEGGTVVLVENNGVVPWAGATGWGFAGIGISKSFDTGIIPTNDQAYAIFAQFDNGALAGGLQFITGGGGLVWNIFGVSHNNGGNNSVMYGNGAPALIAPNVASGNLAMIGNQGYRNGVVDGAPGGAFTQPPATTYIGARNVEPAAGNFATADVHAVIICDDATVFTAPDITAIAGSPGGSMHNL